MGIFRAALFGATFWVACPAFAQVVIEATTSGIQADVRRDNAGFISCGFRAIVIDVTQQITETHDFSIAVNAEPLGGLVKAGKLRIKTADIGKNPTSRSVVTPEPVNFWIAKTSEGKRVMPAKLFKADNQGFVLGVVEAPDALEIVLAVLEGVPIQFATRYKDQQMDAIVGFTPEVDKPTFAALSSCLAGFMDRVQ